MKSTNQLLEDLRQLAFEGGTDQLRLIQILTEARGGRAVEAIIFDYLRDHWRVDTEVIDEAISQWVLVEPGTFQMGSPPSELGHRPDEAPREVEITERLLVQASPVTQAQWEAVTGKNPACFKGHRHPAETLSWWDAIEFCNTLSKREGLAEAYEIVTEAPKRRWGSQDPVPVDIALKAGANGYRLLTEAQWEYACRAGTEMATYAGDLTHGRWGEPDEHLAQIAWYDVNSEGRTREVRRKKPNAWGLYDMLGNVWEWTETAFEEADQIPRVRPYHAPPTILRRVVRGGAWGVAYGTNLRAARRGHDDPDHRANDLGFRCARVI